MPEFDDPGFEVAVVGAEHVKELAGVARLALHHPRDEPVEVFLPFGRGWGDHRGRLLATVAPGMVAYTAAGTATLAALASPFAAAVLPAGILASTGLPAAVLGLGGEGLLLASLGLAIRVLAIRVLAILVWVASFVLAPLVLASVVLATVPVAAFVVAAIAATVATASVPSAFAAASVGVAGPGCSRPHRRGPAEVEPHPIRPRGFGLRGFGPGAFRFGPFRPCAAWAGTAEAYRVGPASFVASAFGAAVIGPRRGTAVVSRPGLRAAGLGPLSGRRCPAAFGFGRSVRGLGRARPQGPGGGGRRGGGGYQGRGEFGPCRAGSRCRRSAEAPNGGRFGGRARAGRGAAGRRAAGRSGRRARRCRNRRFGGRRRAGGRSLDGGFHRKKGNPWASSCGRSAAVNG